MRRGLFLLLLALLAAGPLLGLVSKDTMAGVRLIIRPEPLIWFSGFVVLMLLIQALHRRGSLHTLLRVLSAERVPTFPGWIGVGILFILPFFLNRAGLDMAGLWLLYVGLGLGLSITIQRTGLLDLGYAAFYALGAYTFAMLAVRYGVSFWVALPLSALVAGLVGVVVGIPLLRLRGDYFAIGTLGFAEILGIVLRNESALTGGPNGLDGVPRPTLFGIDFARTAAPGQVPFHEVLSVSFAPEQRLWFYYYLTLAVLGLVIFITRRLSRSDFGRALEAVREDEIACQAVGLSVSRLKIAAYAIAGSIGGLMGCLFAARQGFISPESFSFNESVLVLAVVVLSGGRMLGTFIAAGVLVLLPELARGLEDYRMMVFGAVLVLVMLWRPQGLGGKRIPSITVPPA
jgi:branched-chain amino acid transport system permease protein